MTKSLNWELLKNDDKITARLGGELSRDTLQPLWSQRDSFLSAAKNSALLIWDLTALTRIDSAGFALLCDLLQAAQTQSTAKVRLENAPKQLETLADLFGLSAWFSPFIQNGKS